MRRFLRKTSIPQEPLPVAMSGVRMGERVLQVGVDDARASGVIAAKTGLSGQSWIAVANDAEAARARAATIDAGILADIHTGPFGDPLPMSDASFDAIVVHSMHDLLPGLDADARQRLLRECFRILRPGGRLLVVEAGPRSGFSAMLRPAPATTPYDDSGGAVSGLQLSGFKPVRVLAERDGFKFTEGLKAS
jgi:SAM-dependent methyltransferase